MSSPKGSESSEPSNEALITFDGLEEFQAVVKDAKEAKATLIVCFSASWCGPCKLIAPFLAEQAEAFASKPAVRLAKTVMSAGGDDVDDLMDVLVTDYGIRITGLPHFAVIQGGTAIKEKSWSGANRELLVARLTEFSVPDN
jgi:thioredoxin 1